MHVLLSGIVGSTAYGLAHEGSDVDRLGVFAVPTGRRLHALTAGALRPWSPLTVTVSLEPVH